MKIGISAPIEVASLKKHFEQLSAYDETLGLGGTAVNILIDGFINAGHEVIVFTLDPKIRTKYVLEGKGLKIVFGHFRLSAYRKLLDFCSIESKQITAFIKEEKGLDIVNAHWSYEFAIGTITSKLPHLITFRDHALTILKLAKHPYRFVRLLMDSWVRRSGKHFSYNSEYLKCLIKKEGVVIPNAVSDIEIKEHKNWPGNQHVFRLCFVANGWDFRKNPETAIRAFNILKRKQENVELHLFGKSFQKDGDGYCSMEQKGLNSGVFYHGETPHSILMKELGDFDILVHTAREESFGNNLVEAMAKGIPVVAGKSAGAVPWVLDYGKAGCLVDVDNAEDVASALESLIVNKAVYETFSVNGINNVRERFSQTSVCNTYIEEYKKIIANEGSACL